MAVRKGLKLNEYGLFEAASGDLLAAETEAEVYEALGLPYIEPTLREDRGEIEAALAGELPDLITLQQIRGDLHTHTNLTDGLATWNACSRPPPNIGTPTTPSPTMRPTSRCSG